MTTKVRAYTTDERNLLEELVNKYKPVNDDSATAEEKRVRWLKVTEEYNAQVDIITGPRTTVQLRKLCSNSKQVKRKVVTPEKPERFTTDGKELPICAFAYPVVDAVEITAPETFTVPCPWDSTAMYINDVAVKEEAVDDLEGSDDFVEEKNEPPTTTVPIVKQPPPLFIPNGFKTHPHKSKLTLQDETNLRIHKVNEALHQQTQIHGIRVQIEEMMLKKAKLELKKAEAEAELAELKLKKFKTDCGL